MADQFSVAMRSWIMSRVGSKDTTPEMFVRRLLHGMGLRYTLHRADLPGKPDIVLPRHRAVIFVHGCFWHAHRCRAGQRAPRSNAEYWRCKRERNATRDRQAVRLLRRANWSVLVIWECQTRKPSFLRRRIAEFLHLPS